MVDVISERKRPSFSERLNSALGQGLEQGSQLYQGHKQNEALKKLGIDPDIHDPEYRKVLLQGFAKKKEGDVERFSTGLDILGQMRTIAAKRNIGRGSAFMGFFPGETARDRAHFEQLGKSLIPIVAAGVPIRNQREFDEYKKVITDPSSSLDAIEGAIEGLEDIFQKKLMSGGKGKGDELSELEASGKSTALKNVKKGTPLTLEAMQQIYEKVGGDESKARALAKKMGYQVE